MSTDPADIGKRLTKARAQLALNDRLLSPPGTAAPPTASEPASTDDDLSAHEFPKPAVSPPPERIDVTSNESVATWAGRLCVSEETLRLAVAKVGPMPAAVTYYLARCRGRVPQLGSDESGASSDRSG